MQKRYRLLRRGCRGGVFYLVDKKTGARESLHTSDADAAEQILIAKNQTDRQPALNLQIAKAFLFGADGSLTQRTWRHALEALITTKQAVNRQRWLRAAKDPAYPPLLDAVIIETTADLLLLKVMEAGTVSTNIYLRRLHNFCVDMNWLPWPLIPKRQWPVIRFKEKRAITADEHARIVEREGNPERQAFYQLAWHLGASQSDLAHLHAEDIDWTEKVICFERQKVRWRNVPPAQIRFGKEVEKILFGLPRKGPIFPSLIHVLSEHRATEFRQRCHGLGIHGVTLHSYRYAWAERAKAAG